MISLDPYPLATDNRGQTLTDWLYLRAQRPAEIAFRIESVDHAPVDMTCGDLRARAEGVARGLSRLGVRAQDRVLLMLPTGVEFLVILHGLLRLGAVPAPTYPPSGWGQLATFTTALEELLDVVKPRLIVIMDVLRDLLATGPSGERWRDRTDLVIPADIDAADSGAVELPPAPVPDDLALVQFSSGSTGVPRGICLTHANLLANIHGLSARVDLGPADTVVSWLPLYHDMGLIGVALATLVRGSKVVLFSPLDFLRRPEFWLLMMAKYRATISVAPQFAFNLCLLKSHPDRLTGVDLSTVRFILNGAEPIHYESVAEFEQRYAVLGLRPGVVTAAYGLGENSLAVAIPEPGRGLRRRTLARAAFEQQQADDGEGVTVVSCGPPIPGTEVCIRGPNGERLPERSIGEVYVRGAAACRLLLTADGFVPIADAEGWVRTGDNGFLADDELYVTGRIKDLIIVAGRNIYPQDLETEVAKIAGVRSGRAVVFGTWLADLGTEGIVVAAETTLTGADDHATLAANIRKRLSHRFGVNAYDVLLLPRGQLPLTSSGKVRRFKVRAEYQNGSLQVVFGRTLNQVASA